MAKTVLKVSTLIDGLESDTLHDMFVTVDGTLIQEVSASYEGDPSLVEDLSGHTLIPGLIDAHVHLVWNCCGVPHHEVELDRNPARTVLRMVPRARIMLESGITTARDLGSTDSLATYLARAIREGEIMGPEIISAGRAIAITGGHAYQIASEADGADMIRRAVREEIKRGARAIKFMASGGIYDEVAQVGDPQLTYEELLAGNEEAHKVGLRTAAHAYTPGPINTALDAGVNTIEHGSFMDEVTIDRMAREERYWVPTMMASHLIVEQALQSGAPEYMVSKARNVRDAVREGVAYAIKTGSPLAGGTDSGGSGIDHGNMALEIELFLACGATIEQAISYCTWGSAKALGIDNRVGAINPGLEADLVLVRGDVCEVPGAVRNVERVYKAGAVVVGR